MNQKSTAVRDRVESHESTEGSDRAPSDRRIVTDLALERAPVYARVINELWALDALGKSYEEERTMNHERST